MEEVKIVTHSGSFHPDDVFAVATLSLILEYDKSLKIIRSRDPEIIKNGDYVVDVGGIYDEGANKFDHHQETAAGDRSNGVPYASFGLVWKKFGPELTGSKEVANHIDKKLVQSIDAADNGVGEFKPMIADIRPYSLGLFIIYNNVTWKEDPEITYDQFLKMVEFAKQVLRREIKFTRDEVEGKVIVEEVYKEASDKRLIILDKNYPWGEVLDKYKEPLFVVEPDLDIKSTRWKVRAIRKELFAFDNRKDLPKVWAGKTGKELQEVTGVADALFCHNARFIAVANSKTSAIKLAEIALKS